MFIGAIGFSLAFIANVPTGGLINLGPSNVSMYHQPVKLQMLAHNYTQYIQYPVFIFIPFTSYTQPIGTAHYAIGIIVMFLHIVNVSLYTVL